MNAMHNTEVSISTASGTDVVNVSGNWSLHYEFPYDQRTVHGVEDKGTLRFVRYAHPGDLKNLEK